jgi:hypothetical protein
LWLVWSRSGNALKAPFLSAVWIGEGIWRAFVARDAFVESAEVGVTVSC